MLAAILIIILSSTGLTVKRSCRHVSARTEGSSRQGIVAYGPKDDPVPQEAQYRLLSWMDGPKVEADTKTMVVRLIFVR